MLENKYTLYYNKIINNAKNRQLNGYYEIHHNIPKSLGGSNLKENLVNLTAKEHFVCHLLLTKMYVGSARNKMLHAAWAMATLENNYQQRYKITSKIYESLRIKYANLRSESSKGKPGRKHSEETKKKLSLAHIGRKRKPMSEESKKRLSKSMTGKNIGKKRTKEQSEMQSIRQTGKIKKPHSEETKLKISKALKGKARTKMSALPVKTSH